MAFSRTWIHSKANQLASSFDGSDDSLRMRHWGLTAIPSLVSAQGVTVWKSSNSLAVSTGSSNLTTLGSFVSADPGSPHSWIVLQFANGGQLLLSFDSTTVPQMDGTWSPGAMFTGGSTTADPTAVDGVPAFDTSFDFRSSAIAGDDVVHVLWTTDGAYVMLFWTTLFSGDLLATFERHIWAVTIDDKIDVTVPSSWCGGGSQFSTGSPALHSHLDPDDLSVSIYTEKHANSQDPSSGDPFNSNRHAMWSFGCYEDNQGYGFLGRLHDVYERGDLGDSGAVSGKVLVLSNGDRYACITPDQAVPWDSSGVRIDSGSLVVDNVNGFIVPTGASSGDSTPPVITPSTPTPNTNPGTPGAMPLDYVTAKFTPIVVQITDAEGLSNIVLLVVTALFLDGSAETVYRNGFVGGYVTGSSPQVITNGIQLSIKRSAGWPGKTVTGGDLAVGLAIDAVDAGGNLTSSTIYYKMPPQTLVATPPVVIPPIPGAADIINEGLSLIISQFRSET